MGASSSGTTSMRPAAGGARPFEHPPCGGRQAGRGRASSLRPAAGGRAAGGGGAAGGWGRVGSRQEGWV